MNRSIVIIIIILIVIIKFKIILRLTNLLDGAK